MSESTEVLYSYDPEKNVMVATTHQKASPPPTEAEKSALIRAEIEKLYGKVNAQDTLRYWPSISRRLGFDTKPAKSDALEFRVDQFISDPTKKLTQLEKYQAASREKPLPAPDALPVSMYQPRTPVDNPTRKLAFANAVQPSSKISGLLRKWIQADSSYAANVSTNSALARVALETREQLESQIAMSGWKPPKSRVA